MSIEDDVESLIEDRVRERPGVDTASVRSFRVVALVEATSYLVLVTAAVSRRATDLPDVVPVVGLVHGVIFLAYFALALAVRPTLGWTARTTLVVVLASVLPLGGYLVEQRLVPRPRPRS